jgi:hypothetical protein
MIRRGTAGMYLLQKEFNPLYQDLSRYDVTSMPSDIMNAILETQSQMSMTDGSATRTRYLHDKSSPP